MYDMHAVLNMVFVTRGGLGQLFLSTGEIFTNKRAGSQLLVPNHFGQLIDGYTKNDHVTHEAFVFLGHIRELRFVVKYREVTFQEWNCRSSTSSGLIC